MLISSAFILLSLLALFLVGGLVPFLGSMGIWASLLIITKDAGVSLGVGAVILFGVISLMPVLAAQVVVSLLKEWFASEVRGEGGTARRALSELFTPLATVLSMLFFLSMPRLDLVFEAATRVAATPHLRGELVFLLMLLERIFYLASLTAIPLIVLGLMAELPLHWASSARRIWQPLRLSAFRICGAAVIAFASSHLLGPLWERLLRLE
jgi:hypothetical protein